MVKNNILFISFALLTKAPAGKLEENTPNLSVNIHRTQLGHGMVFDENLSHLDLVKLYASFIKSGEVEKAKTLNTVLENLHLKLAGTDLSKLDLTEINLSHADLQNAELYETDLVDANLKYADLKNANLYSANLEGANLEGANLERATLSRGLFFNANLKDANLIGADLWSSALRGAWLSEDLQINYKKNIKELFKEWAKNDARRPLLQKLINAGIRIIGSVSAEELKQVNWEGLSFEDSKAIHALFNSVAEGFDGYPGDNNLDFEDIWYNDVGYSTYLVKLYSRSNDDEREDFYDTFLTNFNLYLKGADLRGLNLQGLSLECSNLQDANLQGANLQDANLQGANLQEANLQDANLQGANLIDADLRDVKVKYLDLLGHLWFNAKFSENVPIAAGTKVSDTVNSLRQRGVSPTPLSAEDFKIYSILRLKNYSQSTDPNHRTSLNSYFQTIKFDLREADLKGLNLTGIHLAGANLGGSNLQGANLQGANLQGVKLRRANLIDADLKDVKLDSLSLLNNYWFYARLSENSSIGCVDIHNISGVIDFLLQRGVLLIPISAEDFKIYFILQLKNYSQSTDPNRRTSLNSYFQTFNLDLRGADLKGLNLRGIHLVGANLEGADLSGSDLTDADLTGAKLSSSDLNVNQWLNVKLSDDFVITEDHLGPNKAALIEVLELRGMLIEQEKLEDSPSPFDMNKEDLFMGLKLEDECQEPPLKKVKVEETEDMELTLKEEDLSFFK